jgi:hypothetical protein
MAVFGIAIQDANMLQHLPLVRNTGDRNLRKIESEIGGRRIN